MTRENAIELLLDELDRAERLHPQWPLSDVDKSAIVAEEAGELIKATLNYYYHNGGRDDMRTEAIHTGAMALRFLINMEEV